MKERLSPEMMQFVGVGIVAVLIFGVVAAVQAGNDVLTVAGDLVKWVVVPAVVLTLLFWKREEFRILVENTVHSRALTAALARAEAAEAQWDTLASTLVDEYGVLFGEPDTTMDPRAMLIEMRAEIMSTRSERDTTRRTLLAYEAPETGYIAQAAHYQGLAAQRLSQLSIAEQVGQRFAGERDEALKVARLATERADNAEQERDEAKAFAATTLSETRTLLDQNNAAHAREVQTLRQESANAIATLEAQLAERSPLSWHSFLSLLEAAHQLPSINMNNLASLAREQGLEVGKGIIADGTWKSITAFTRNALLSPAVAGPSNKLLLRAIGEGTEVNEAVNGENDPVHSPVNGVVNGIHPAFVDLHEGVNDPVNGDEGAVNSEEGDGDG